MTLALSPLLTAFLDAHNTHDCAAFMACLADDATVRDEGRVHHGREAIGVWFDDVCRRYQAVIEVTEVSEVDGEPVLAGRVSGNFDGSPIALHYFVAIDGDKIVSLRIVV